MFSKLSNLSYLKRYKLTLGLIVFVLLILTSVFFIYQKYASSQKDLPQEEITLNFDPEGAYAILSPRRDGNAMVVNVKRTASYDSITYSLAYSDSDGIDRGVGGDIQTGDSKGEYEQEVLFGTCSKNICKYDKGVENGTLELRLKKKNKVYKMLTAWHLQQPDIALGVLSSGDGHFTYKTDASREQLSLIGFTIINDLTGVPKLPDGKQVLGKVYTLNPPIAKTVTEGSISVELAENPSSDAKIYRYDSGKSQWEELETKVNQSKLEASASGSGIFAVFVPKNGN